MALSRISAVLGGFAAVTARALHPTAWTDRYPRLGRRAGGSGVGKTIGRTGKATGRTGRRRACTTATMAPSDAVGGDGLCGLCHPDWA